MKVPKSSKKKISGRIGNQGALDRRLTCPNKFCDDRFIAGLKNIVKGSPYGPQKRPRWLCTTCGRTFSESWLRGKTFRKKKRAEIQTAIFLRRLKFTIRQISNTLQVSKTSVVEWLKPR